MPAGHAFSLRSRNDYRNCSNPPPPSSLSIRLLLLNKIKARGREKKSSKSFDGSLWVATRSLLRICLFCLYHLFSCLFPVHFETDEISSPPKKLENQNHYDLPKGSLQHVNSKPVFLTVHDMGSNRKSRKLFFLVLLLSVYSYQRFAEEAIPKASRICR